MESMLTREIYEVMRRYALRAGYDCYGDSISYDVTFPLVVDGTKYSVLMKTESLGTVNHVEFSFPDRIPEARMKEASRVANELNSDIRFGAFRLVEHNGRVRYCFDTFLKSAQVTADYFEEIMDLSIRTVEAYAPRLLALCR